MNLENFLLLSAILFSIGLYGVISKKNLIIVLMGLELMFNAINISAVAFSRYVTPYAQLDGLSNTFLVGQVFTLFIITVSAAEVALGVAIIFAFYRNKKLISVENSNILKN